MTEPTKSPEWMENDPKIKETREAKIKSTAGLSSAPPWTMKRKLLQEKIEEE